MPFAIRFDVLSNLQNVQGSENDILITTDTLRQYIYKDNQWILIGNSASISELSPPVVDLNLNYNKISNLAPGTLSTDAVVLG